MTDSKQKNYRRQKNEYLTKDPKKNPNLTTNKIGNTLKKIKRIKAPGHDDTIIEHVKIGEENLKRK